MPINPSRLENSTRDLYECYELGGGEARMDGIKGLTAPGAQMVIPICFEGVKLRAMVDTGAERCILNPSWPR